MTSGTSHTIWEREPRYKSSRACAPRQRAKRSPFLTLYALQHFKGWIINL